MALSWQRCVGLTMLLLVTCGVTSLAADESADTYAYTDTRTLVDLVERAAALVETEGESAFQELSVRGSDWFDGGTYFFAYALDGTCLLNPPSPELVGQNLIDLKDINGKPLIRYITDIGRQDARDASGWVFYLWQEGAQLSPDWKSAFVRKVVMPDGRTVVLGSGVYDIKIERVFVQRRIDRAVELLQSQGSAAAFDAFRDPSTPFNFLETYVFVLDDSGHTLVDPAFPNMSGRDMRAFHDAVGQQPIVELLDKLAGADEAWVQYLWPRPGEASPSRKLIYARKVTVEGKTMIVGSDYFLATPIWMRVEEARPWPHDLPA